MGSVITYPLLLITVSVALSILQVTFLTVISVLLLTNIQNCPMNELSVGSQLAVAFYSLESKVLIKLFVGATCMSPFTYTRKISLQLLLVNEYSNSAISPIVTVWFIECDRK